MIQNIVPAFKAGQKVFVKDIPGEKPSVCCKRHYSCRVWAPVVTGEIIEPKMHGGLIRCMACHGIFPSPDNYFRVKLINGIVCAVPYTWLTPVD